MKKYSLLCLVAIVALGLNACGDDGSSASTDVAANDVVVDDLSSSSEVDLLPDGEIDSVTSSATNSSASSSSSSVSANSNSSLPVCLAEVPECGYTPPSSSSANPALDSVVNADTTKVSYSLKAFKGPFTNPHKGFCVTIEGTWAFSEEWEYAPTGAKNNRAWDVVSHGCGYQRWNKLNPAKGVYDWTDFEKLLNAHAEHGLGYGLRVFPYASPMGRKNKYTVESDYDWTPSFVYEEGAKKDYAKMKDGGVEYTLAVPRWDDPIYIQAAKDFAAALAAKYDGDPRLEYIDIRAFGNWGEWHIAHFDGSQMPSDSVQIDINKENADSLSKVLGYNFSISKAELVTVTRGVDAPGGADETTHTLNITVKNTGLAPCFFDVYMVAEFVDAEGKVLEQLGKTVYIPKGTFKDEDVKEFSFANSIAGGVFDVATQPGVGVALSIYESEEAYKAGKNPTVKFDNDGIMENNKLLLK